MPLLTEVKYTLDAEGVITEISENVESLIGYPREKCLGRFLGDLIHPAHRHLAYPLLSSSPVEDAGPKGMTVAFIDSEGAMVYVWLQGEAVFEDDGQLREIRGVLRDMTVPRHREKAAVQAVAKLEAELKQAVVKDALTGVYNRLYFEDKIRNLNTTRFWPVSILIVDIDGLGKVNDALGFQAGNQLLIDAADLIRRTFRDSDIAARTGDSEFTIILGKTGEQGLNAIRQRFRKAVADYNKQNPELHLNLTIGTATAEAPDQDLREVYLQAERVISRKKLHRPKSVRNSVVQLLSTALAERDYITEAHAERISHYATLLGTSVGLSEHQLADLQLLAQFHDIGKLAVPDCILLKPGPLTPEERIKMNRHPEVGYRIALSSPDLAPIADKILTHHEWWNGEGYPLKISGTDIPLECRILAVVDAYDAMTSDRPYRKAMHHRDAMQELVRCSGTQFDPQVVRSFIRLTDNCKGLYVCQS